MLLSHQPGRLGMLLGETLTLAFCLLSIHPNKDTGPARSTVARFGRRVWPEADTVPNPRG